MAGSFPADCSPFIRVFNPSDYHADPQTYCSIQGPDGMMYFGNNRGGILEFDGAVWSFIDSPENGVVRSLAVGPDGKIYAGSTGDFGFLDELPNGKKIFKSLKFLVPEEFSDFNEIWKIERQDSSLYFLSSRYLFHLKNSKLSVLTSFNGNFSNLFKLDGSIWLVEKTGGIFLLEGMNPRPVCTSPEAKSEDFPFAFRSASGEMILVSERKGLFTLKDGILSSIPGKASEYLKNYACYLQAASLGETGYALPTIRGGVLVIDRNGNFLTSLTENNGLQSNIIYAVYRDSESGLWISGEMGISRAEFPSAWSFYSKPNGLKGIVLSLHEDRERLYAGTMHGLFSARFSENGTSRTTENLVFTQNSLIRGEVWHLSQLGSSVLAATSEGLAVITDGIPKIINRESQSCILISKHHPGYIFTGSPTGVFVYRGSPASLTFAGKIAGFSSGAYSIHEDKAGNIWTGSFTEGVHCFKFSGSDFLNPEVLAFNESNGLPPAENFTAEFNADPVILTVKGLFRFAKESNRFFQIPDFPHQLADASSILKQISDSVFWLTNSYHVFQVTLNGKTCRIRDVPFNRLPPGGIWAIIPSSDGSFWLGGDHGVFRYNPAISLNSPPVFTSMIRKAESDGKMLPLKSESLVLDWAQRNVGFMFSAPSFDGDGKLEYQFRLNGFHPEWSAWTPEIKKEFTNLPPGDYVFEVRAKTIYGRISDPAVLPFRVNPAWFNSKYAYLSYILLSLLLIYGYVRWRIRKTQEEKIRLEQLVQEKTSELAQSYEQLKQSQAQLIQSEKMASIGTLVAGIAHEINNPVNFIQASIYPLKEDLTDLTEYLNVYGLITESLAGQELPEKTAALVSQLRSLEGRVSAGELKKEISDLIAGIENGSERTSDIVKSLRNFSRLDENDMKVFDLAEGLRITLKLLEKEYSGRIEVTIRFHHTSLLTGFPGQINQVMMNLLLNAMQAIPGKGSIEIETSETEEEIKLSIKDSGIGINPQNLPRLFDPFFTTKPVGKGTGLGLSISYQIIQKHHGKILVSSVPGEGSTFTVILPKHPVSGPD